MKNLEHYPQLYDLAFSLIFDGMRTDYSQLDPTVNLGTLHGIFGRSEQGALIIHNRIYRELIAEMMMSKWRISHGTQVRKPFESSEYGLPNGGLNMEKVISNFQVFMREQHSDKDQKFLERDTTHAKLREGMFNGTAGG